MDRLLALHRGRYFTKKRYPHGPLVVVLFHGSDADLLDMEELAAQLEHVVGPEVKIASKQSAVRPDLHQIETASSSRSAFPQSAGKSQLGYRRNRGCPQKVEQLRIVGGAAQ